MNGTSSKRPISAAVYLVADNLDAVLAAGEDLLRVAAGAEKAMVSLANSIRVLEMTIAARCMQARARAAELRLADLRYKSLIDLFVAGTRPLVDAIDDLGDSTHSDFQSGGCPVSYLRSRRAISDDAIGSGLGANANVSDRFLVAGRIELGSLLDLCATFLDRLEDHYELYATDENESASQADSRTGAPVELVDTAA